MLRFAIIEINLDDWVADLELEEKNTAHSCQSSSIQEDIKRMGNPVLLVCRILLFYSTLENVTIDCLSCIVEFVFQECYHCMHLFQVLGCCSF